MNAKLTLSVARFGAALVKLSGTAISDALEAHQHAHSVDQRYAQHDCGVNTHAGADVARARRRATQQLDAAARRRRREK